MSDLSVRRESIAELAELGRGSGRGGPSATASRSGDRPGACNFSLGSGKLREIHGWAAGRPRCDFVLFDSTTSPRSPSITES